MAAFGKLETDVEIKSSAEKFHDVFSCRPHHVSKMSPEKIQSCDLHDGGWGKEGSVICWNYTHDGKQQTAKQKIEKIDDANLLTTVKVIEGDLLKKYKSFKITIQAIPKGEGSLVHWTFEYEKIEDQIPHPNSLLEFVMNWSKDIDAHLLQTN